MIEANSKLARGVAEVARAGGDGGVGEISGIVTRI